MTPRETFWRLTHDVPASSHLYPSEISVFLEEIGRSEDEAILEEALEIQRRRFVVTRAAVIALLGCIGSFVATFWLADGPLSLIPLLVGLLAGAAKDRLLAHDGRQVLDLWRRHACSTTVLTGRDSGHSLLP